MILLGHIAGTEDSCVRFSTDLEASLADGDTVYARFVESVDRYIEQNGLRCDPSDARRIRGDERVRNEVTALDLAQAGISSIVWATGFSRHFDWIEVPRSRPVAIPCMFVESVLSQVHFSWASGGSTRAVRISSMVLAPMQRM